MIRFVTRVGINFQALKDASASYGQNAHKLADLRRNWMPWGNDQHGCWEVGARACVPWGS